MIDESRGDVFKQICKRARGYPDRPELWQKRDIVFSHEVPSDIRIKAAEFLGEIASKYALEELAQAVLDSPEAHGIFIV